MRIDKWLWCARFFKTRSLAIDEINKGRIWVNDSTIKPSREIRCGDVLRIRQGHFHKTVIVRAMLPTRGPASVAQQMYEETAESLQERSRQAELRRLAPEPALHHRQGRPTKKNRREIDSLRDTQPPSKHPDNPIAELDSRWSAFL